MAEMEFSQNKPDLFEIETNNNVLTAENLPIYLFQEIEADYAINYCIVATPKTIKQTVC